jgi:hypothetical protein
MCCVELILSHLLAPMDLRCVMPPPQQVEIPLSSTNALHPHARLTSTRGCEESTRRPDSRTDAGSLLYPTSAFIANASSNTPPPRNASCLDVFRPIHGTLVTQSVSPCHICYILLIPNSSLSSFLPLHLTVRSVGAPWLRERLCSWTRDRIKSRWRPLVSLH